MKTNMKNKEAKPVMKPSFFKRFGFSNWGLVKAYRDIENFLDWKRTIDKQVADPKSQYNKWGLEHTKLYDIFTTVSIDEQYGSLPEQIQRTQLVEMLNPLHRYLDDDLGFAECLNCEFNQFVDEKEKPTLSYLIVYRFNFNKLSITWIAKMLILLGVLSYGAFHLSTIVAWLSSLM